jgi:antirestriction protein ArdC
LIHLNGTEDARGFKAWNKAGRFVNKGAKAIHIFAPIFINKEEQKEYVDSNGNTITKTDKRRVLIGFKTIPVFRYEDTHGVEIPKKEPIENVKIPSQFEALIKELSITVESRIFEGGAYGVFKPYSNKIELMSPEMRVFLHELSHAIDVKVIGSKISPDHSDMEFVAELSSAVLCNLLGYNTDLGTVKDYLQSWGYKGIKEQVNLIERVVKVCDYVVNRTLPHKYEAPSE